MNYESSARFYKKNWVVLRLFTSFVIFTCTLPIRGGRGFTLAATATEQTTL